MRFLAILAVIASLLSVPATGWAASATDCSARQTTLNSLGKPSPAARLLSGPGGAQTQVTRSVSDVYVVRPGDTLSQLAARYNTSVSAIMQANGLQNPNLIVSGQRLIIPGAAVIVTSPAGTLPAPLLAAWIDGEAVQGEAALIWVSAAAGTSIVGQLGTQTIPFQYLCGLHWGLVAFDALNDAPGPYNLALTAWSGRGRSVSATVPITLRAGNFWSGPLIQYPPDRRWLLDPALIRSENDRLNNLFAGLPPSPPRWSGPFWLPLNTVMTGSFGSRGLVDGKPVGYHEGVDLRARVPTPIGASAPGVVVLAERLTVRGNTVFLDHGAGVITGYFHMSRIDVAVGDYVNAGGVLGLTGDTGLVTGAHLHWEMRVNGRWVNPYPWTSRSIP